jgi:hypothetical protein
MHGNASEVATIEQLLPDRVPVLYPVYLIVDPHTDYGQRNRKNLQRHAYPFPIERRKQSPPDELGHKLPDIELRTRRDGLGVRFNEPHPFFRHSANWFCRHLPGTLRCRWLLNANAPASIWHLCPPG